MLASKCMLSLSPIAADTRAQTHTDTDSHSGTDLLGRRAKWSKENNNYSVNYSLDKSVEWAIEIAKYIESTWCRVYVFKYLQATWVDYAQEEATQKLLPTGAQRGKPSVENWHWVSPRVKPLLQKTEVICKLTLKWHLLWIMQDDGRRVSKLTFHNDLRIWSAEVENSRSDAGQPLEGESGDGQQGSVSVKKPEDPGYLLLLAAPRTKERTQHFFFYSCLIANNEGI